MAGYGQQVRACALGQAAASILGRHIVGQDAATLRQLVGVMRSMLKDNGPPPGPDFANGAFNDLEVLVPVREHKARHNAVLLAVRGGGEGDRPDRGEPESLNGA